MRFFCLLALLLTTYFVATPGIAQERIVLKASEFSSADNQKDTLYTFPLTEHAYWQPNENIRIKYNISCSIQSYPRQYDFTGWFDRVFRTCSKHLFVNSTNRFAPFLEASWSVGDTEIRPRYVSDLEAGIAITRGKYSESSAFAAIRDMDVPEITHDGTTYVLEDFHALVDKHLQNQYDIFDAQVTERQENDRVEAIAALILMIIAVFVLWVLCKKSWRGIKRVRASVALSAHKRDREKFKQHQIDEITTTALKEQAKLAVHQRHTQDNLGTSRADSLRSQIQLALENNDVETAKILLNELDKIEDKKPAQSGG